jgi:hypothetical protein
LHRRNAGIPAARRAGFVKDPAIRIAFNLSKMLRVGGTADKTVGARVGANGSGTRA